MKTEDSRTVVEHERDVTPLASEGHGYNVDETNQQGAGDRLTSRPVAATPAELHETHGTHGSVPVQVTAGKLGSGFWTGLIVLLLVIAGIVVWGIHKRSAADVVLTQDNKTSSVPEVKVVFPTGGVASGTLALPGNTQAYVDTPIYSRTNGYLKKWYFDIGARVKQGQLMALVETPEVDQQLQAAQADLKVAQANLNLAKTTEARYTNLLKSNSVSKQETDQAVSDAAARQAALEASEAAVRRYQQLQSFEQIYAPYSGIVTARNTDIGDLIQGGLSGAAAARPLFQLAEISTLRVYVSVPEVYSTFVRNGGTATLTADEYPGQTFTGDIARNASAIDPASRTLNVEVDVPNPGGKLLPGAYVMVHFKVPTTGTNLTLPSNTLLFRAQGMQVGVVRDGKVALVPVKIAADHGQTVEVSSGLTKDDQVILDPSDSLANGQPVKVTGGASK
jgi:RND family efflux transporter MFP subunit